MIRFATVTMCICNDLSLLNLLRLSFAVRVMLDLCQTYLTSVSYSVHLCGVLRLLLRFFSFFSLRLYQPRKLFLQSWWYLLSFCVTSKHHGVQPNKPPIFKITVMIVAMTPWASFLRRSSTRVLMHTM